MDNRCTDSFRPTGDDDDLIFELEVHASSSEIEKATVDRIVHAGDESSFVRAQEQGEGSDFCWFPHSSDGLRLRQLFEHFLFAPGISFKQVTVDKRRVHP